MKVDSMVFIHAKYKRIKVMSEANRKFQKARNQNITDF